MTTEPVADSTYFIPEESVTGPLGEVYQQQLAFERAEREYDFEREQAWHAHEEAQRAAAGRGLIGPISDPESHPNVVKARGAMEIQRTFMEGAQAKIGGIVFCVANDNLPKLQRKLESLSKRAVKLGLDPITLTPSEETVLLHYTYAEDQQRGYNADFLHTYCLLTGGTPKVEGFHFLASIEHTEAGNIVKKIPPLAAMMKGLVNSHSEEAAAEALEQIDVTEYRSTPPLCQHCNKIRSRKDTYLVYNDETGEIKQVGRSCLRDYTGADNPESIIKFLEMYFEHMRSLRVSRGERPVIRTRDFLAHVTVVLGSGYQSQLTKEWALENYFNMVHKKRDPRTNRDAFTAPNEADYATADAMIDWALNKWDASNDYALNVKTAIANEAVPEKGYGLVASVFAAKVRWDRDEEWRQRREQEEAQKAERNFVGEVGERIETDVTVTSINTREGYMGGTAYTVKMEDDKGNLVIWFASNLPYTKDNDMYIVEGGKYVLRATVKEHNEQYKNTKVARGSFIKTISEPEE